jgi:hypothetical protein
VDAARIALPFALAAYFIYMGTRSRIYLLGIPFLMYMRASVFFQNAGVFWVPGRFDVNFLIFFWLVIVWLLCTDLLLPAVHGEARVRRFGGKLSLPEEGIILVLAAATVVQLVLTIAQHGDPATAWSEALRFVYLLAGYFLVRAIVSTASLDEVLGFVRALVIVSTGSAALFVLHQAVHLDIYAGEEYLTTTFLGQTITRSFYFMPQLLLLSIAYIFSRRSWNVWTITALLVNLTAVWISYTRSLVVIAVVVIAISLLVRVFKGSQAGIALRHAVTIGVVLGALAFGVTQFFPVQSQFFLGRISEATAASSVSEVGEVQVRERKMLTTYRSIAQADATLGAGWVSAAQDPMADRVERMQADIVWVPILYRLGVVGVGIFVAAFALYAWRAAKLAASRSRDVELFGIIWLCVIVGTFLEGFVSWTFMQPYRYAMGLWAFAFLGAVASMVRQSLDTLEPRESVKP